MSLANAADDFERDNASAVALGIGPLDPTVEPCDDCPEGDWVDGSTDRQLLEYIARSLSEILTIAGEVRGQVAPVLEQVQGSPIFKMLGGRK